jgi:hypothetical protein
MYLMLKEDSIMMNTNPSPTVTPVEWDDRRQVPVQSSRPVMRYMLVKILSNLIRKYRQDSIQ